MSSRLKIKTVLTLHNYRPLCMNGLFLTPEGEVCERCAGSHPGHGIWRGCYRSSVVQSFGIGAHISFANHKRWYDDVDFFIAPSHFLKDKFVSYGFPASKMKVQGHFVNPWPQEPVRMPSSDILYLGRLSEEKGLHWLVNTICTRASQHVLQIGGDGPLRAWVEQLRDPRVRYLGYLGPKEKAQAVSESSMVVLTSRCLENFPMVIAEANSHGVPVLVPRRGAMAECVVPGINGQHFEAENQNSFYDAVNYIKKAFSDQVARESLKELAKKRFSR